MSERLITLDNVTLKTDSIDGVMLGTDNSFSRIYVNGISIGVTDEMARTVKAMLEQEELTKSEGGDDE